MELHNAVLSMTPGTSWATIHVNHTIILIFSVYCVLFTMTEHLISIMFQARFITQCVALAVSVYSNISVKKKGYLLFLCNILLLTFYEFAICLLVYQH